jgi:hypothetical protein
MKLTSKIAQIILETKNAPPIQEINEAQLISMNSILA